MKLKSLKQESTGIKKELITILIVIALFTIGLLFHEKLHQTPFSLGEYLVFIPAYLVSGWGVLSRAVKNLLKSSLISLSFTTVFLIS